MSNNLAFLCPEVRRQWIEVAAASLNIPLKWVDSDQDQGAIADQLRGVSSVIMGPAKFSVELAKACPDVKFVQMYSAGYDRMDISGLAELGVSVANNGGANAIAVSEHTVALIVALFRKLQLQFNATRDGLWNANIRQDWLHGAWEARAGSAGGWRGGCWAGNAPSSTTTLFRCPRRTRCVWARSESPCPTCSRPLTW